jgi:hypothetical protein
MTKSSDGILEAKQTPRAMGLAYSLWFVTAILAVLSYLAGREMILRSYVRFFPLGEGAYSLINSITSIAMAILPIAIIIGGFEYQHRNMGKPQGWVMLARTFAVEIGMLLLAFYI